MIEFIHTADIHLGLANHGKIDKNTGVNSRIHDVLNAIDYMIDYINEKNIPYLFIAGDVFHTRIPTVYAQIEFAKRLKSLSNAGKGVYILLGNHDVSQLIEKPAVLEIVEKLQLPNLFIIREHEEIYDHDKNLLFIGPYVSEENFHLYMKSFEQNRNGSLPSFVFCHPMIQGSVLSSGIECDTVRDHWTTHCFDEYKWVEYFGLGHIHNHQVICKSPHALYSGSLVSCDFTEKEQKGFIHVKFDGKKTRWKHIEGRNREFLTISGTQEEILSYNGSIEEKIIRLDIKVKATEVLDTEKLNSKFKESFNCIFKVDRERPTLQLEETTNLKDLKSFGLSDVLKEYFSNHSDKDAIVKFAEDLDLKQNAD